MSSCYYLSFFVSVKAFVIEEYLSLMSLYVRKYVHSLQVNYPSSNVKFTPVGRLSWQSYTESTPTADDSDALSLNGLQEQISVTRDNSDYLWYMTE